MTAKEMFEEIGYEIIQSDENKINYSNGNFYIEFDLKYREYMSCSYNDDLLPITLEEHKAITQQMKELGWLDD